MIFDGFGPISGAPNSRDEHDLNLLSDSTWDIAPAATPDLNPRQTASSEDGKLNPAMETTDSVAFEPHTDPTSS